MLFMTNFHPAINLSQQQPIFGAGGTLLHLQLSNCGVRSKSNPLWLNFFVFYVTEM